MFRTLTSILVATVVAACANDASTEPRPGTVEGELSESATRGDAYLFLYEPGEGPPSLPGPPRYATAIPEARLGVGDRRFVFGEVPDGRHRLWGFLDVDLNLRAEVDLLAQPSAGDVAFTAREVLADGVTRLEEPVATGTPYEFHPPAFSVTNAGFSALVPDLPLTPVSFNLLAESVGPFDAARGGFVVSLADSNGDGAPEDLDGDGLLDLFPRIFLRFLPRPGQTVPLNTDGTAADVVVPLLFFPQDFLTLLGGDPSTIAVTPTLTVFVIPRATAVFRASGGRRFTVALEAVPVGAYEMVVVAESGQVWRLPNDLAGDASLRSGGPYPSQRTTFTVFHGSTRTPHGD